MKVHKNEDAYAQSSKKRLADNIKNMIHKCMVNTLSDAELLCGKDTGQFHRFRKSILKVHNTYKRYIDTELGKYNVEIVTQTVEMPMMAEGKEDNNGE